ncbi:MAG: hypothetical protein QNJ81_12050 [Acidimicrobiia bacterium]|nr:hypothetical protein [Acidimicrobiia bacterium]
MSYTRTAIAATVIVATLSVAGPGTQPGTASGGLAGPLPHEAISHRPSLQAPGVTPEVEAAPAAVTKIHAETDEQRQTAEWALREMEAAGLELPPVTIHMHSDRSDCGTQPGEESNGYYTHTATEHIIHSCGSPWILVHELAHLWDNANLDNATRQRILDYQGLESWSHDEWDQAGGEHLASIIAWAIEGTHPRRIGYYDRNHISEVYLMATGRVAPVLADSSPVSPRQPATPTAGTPETELL